MAFRVHDAGPLQVASGRVTACDPLLEPEPIGFDRPVPAGRFPVRLAVAVFPGGDERVAFARVDFADGPVARWEMAAPPGHGPARLGDGEFLGYQVESGIGCLVDPEPFREAAAGDDAFDLALHHGLAAARRTTWTWANVPFSRPGAGNIVAFSSGWGDATYPSFFGVSADGGTVCLLTDFMLFGSGGADS